MRSIIEGSGAELDIVLGTRMIALLWRRLQRGAKNVRCQEWHCRQGTLLGNARRWLKQCGWREKQPWHWRHGELKLDLDLRTLGDKGGQDRAQTQQREDKEKAALNHKVRAGWRWKKWQEFLSSGRRETKGKHQPAVNGKYEEDRAEKTKNIHKICKFPSCTFHTLLVCVLSQSLYGVCVPFLFQAPPRRKNKVRCKI